MYRTLLSSKIHRATVTHADLHYVGSISIDEELMIAADLVEGEQVQVVDINNGARLTTYAIAATLGSGVVGMNGAAARLVAPGDLVIIMAFRQVDEREVRTFHPRVVHVDTRNRVVDLGTDPSAPAPGAHDQLSGALATPGWGLGPAGS
ncbi:aspartate 1-decarboxylase [Frankia sp. AgB1.9]|uniref:aspartate 1-decarboxylase n=1 Tax=unclassified Frankia TaxID=2632575 RepID=UPI00193279FE|nr:MULTISPECIES: aspartate 1-decarboxylase [unclassified Frankia]MBL7492603.1 aspartate 1-decarboxylase [Frankia sp. AgW1.1]MBL7549306.1 aspartate 1-decarboxylase [Frankia sp. AgB1.9]MBL7619227.1 aspartate 1-decarboxylase [Frankia sp. AgB1.8]